MSGGYFDYNQSRISDIVESIKSLIANNNSEEVDQWGDKIFYNFAPEIIEKFKEAIPYIEKSYVYAQRIDWLVSGDDGPETFLERLEEDLSKLETGDKNE